MKWTKLKVRTTGEAIEAVSNLLMENGATGVEIVDEKDIACYEGDAFGEVIDKTALLQEISETSVSAYFPETVVLSEILPMIRGKLAAFASFGLDMGENTVTLEQVDEENWADAWKKYYSPKRITRYLTVVPSWVDYQPEKSDEKCLFLDPGMAFGTGTHPTTRLTLLAMESVFRGGEVTLDVGSGSGVLSIAASLMGASKVYAYDLDEVAVSQARENIHLNPAAQNITVSQGNLLSGVTQKADVIVANILADILILLLEDAKKCLKDQGKMILSGIIADKLPLLKEALHQAEFVIEQTFSEGQWHTLIVRHPDLALDCGIVGG